MKTHSFPTNSQADMCAGPWETSTQDENGIDILSSPSLEDPQQYRIAHVVPWPGVEEIARLMAAAPQLLETLERIRDGAEFCECDHSTKDCCAKQHPVDAFCAFCIADIAIQAARKGSL